MFGSLYFLIHDACLKENWFWGNDKKDSPSFRPVSIIYEVRLALEQSPAFHLG